MNREIKFRIWDDTPIEDGFKGLMINHEYAIESSYLNDALKGKYPIMQYIGRKDKHNKEIYEGDIVRWDDMSKGEKWRVAVVELFPSLQFRIVKIKCDFIQSAQEGKVFKFGNFIYTDTHNHLEIIGNIYENPELLTIQAVIPNVPLVQDAREWQTY